MVKYEKDLNNKSGNKEAQKHDYQINFDLIDGGSSINKNLMKKSSAPKITTIHASKNKTKPVESKQVEAPKKVGPFVPAKMPKSQTSEIVNFPVYFFNPVEIDGKLWVPQPVFPQMMNWDKEKGEFQLPSATASEQAPQPAVPQKPHTPKVEPVVEVAKEPAIEAKSDPFVEDITTKPKIDKIDSLQAFIDEVEQASVAPKTSTEKIKKNLRPIPVRKVAPVVSGASVATKPMKARASEKKVPKVEFNSRPNKFVAPWVQDKKEKIVNKAKKTKKSQDESLIISEAFDVFENSNVKAVKSDTFMHRLVRILLWLLIVLLIGFEATLLVSKPNSNGEISLLFGNGVVQQETNDMSPTINYGDLCFISKQSLYNVNSIIAYVNDEDQFVMHRYLGVDSMGNARTKADSSKTLDKAFNRTNIIGKVDFVLPFAGYLVMFYVDKIILVLLVASLIACYVWKAKRKHT